MKYREFWIEYKCKGKSSAWVYEGEEPADDNVYIHAIEHQAYTDLKQQADMLYEALSELQYQVHDYAIDRESVAVAMASEKAKQALASIRKQLGVEE